MVGGRTTPHYTSCDHPRRNRTRGRRGTRPVRPPEHDGFMDNQEDSPRDVPVLVSLGEEDAPVCEDGSCEL